MSLDLANLYPQGEEITISYDGVHHSTRPLLSRQLHVCRKFFFSCECPACQNDWVVYEDMPDVLLHVPNFEAEAQFKVRIGDKVDLVSATHRATTTRRSPEKNPSVPPLGVGHRSAEVARRERVPPGAGGGRLGLAGPALHPAGGRNQQASPVPRAGIAGGNVVRQDEISTGALSPWREMCLLFALLLTALLQTVVGLTGPGLTGPHCTRTAHAAS